MRNDKINHKISTDSNVLVRCSADFKEAVLKFQLYKPVKVARNLKDEFHNFISSHFINMGIDRWQATLTPLKNSWKFQRT